MRRTPSFTGLEAASPAARRRAQHGSRKTGTTCELVLRRALWSAGLRYRLARPTLAGRPDLIFPRQRVAVFCDGDFWHGRDLANRLKRLAHGHNPSYWVEKISTNCERDHAVTEQLRQDGWRVIRLWESDILHDPAACVSLVSRSVALPKCESQFEH